MSERGNEKMFTAKGPFTKIRRKALLVVEIYTSKSNAVFILSISFNK